MDSVLNSFNKNTRANFYGGKKKKRTMKLFGLYIIGEYGKNFKLKLVLVLVWQSERL